MTDESDRVVVVTGGGGFAVARALRDSRVKQDIIVLDRLAEEDSARDPGVFEIRANDIELPEIILERDPTPGRPVRSRGKGKKRRTWDR